jgi:small conductance mechanosensitive channel
MILLQIAAAAEKVTNVTQNAGGYLDKIIHFGIDYAPKLIGAVVFYLIGSWVIGKISSATKKILSRETYDPSLQTFLVSLIKVALNILLLISIAGILGVDTTAFGALLVGAGVAIGSALNGTLGNFAGGVMMLIFKPFKVGDMIEAQGITGTVIEQGVFSTTVLTAENKTVYIPNGPLSTGVISNFTTHGFLRVDITMAISPNASVEAARESALKAMKQHPKVLQQPSPEVSVLKIGDGMITLAIRPYGAQQDYWDVYFGSLELIKKQWDADNIEGPTPTKIVYNK